MDCDDSFSLDSKKRGMNSGDHGSAPSETAYPVVQFIPHLTVPEFFDLSNGSSLRMINPSNLQNSHHQHQQQQHQNSAVPQAAIGLVWIYGSWSPYQDQYHNLTTTMTTSTSTSSLLTDQNGSSHFIQEFIAQATRGLHCQVFAACLRICEKTDPTGYDLFIDDAQTPSQLPALAVLSQRFTDDNDSDSDNHTKTQKTSTVIRYLRDISPTNLSLYLKMMTTTTTTTTRIISEEEKALLQEMIAKSVRLAVYELEEESDLPVIFGSGNGSSHYHNVTRTAIRIFVAGDRSSVGKSSICLGILGTLVEKMGLSASKVAYIKPATQSESPQLIQSYCQQQGIKCVPIGPLVYYRGFTRAFLAGETADSNELLEQCAAAVDRVARDKLVVVVDGVGFPAVGSICGTDNASMATACGYHDLDIHNNPSGINQPRPRRRRRPMGVVLVGGSGVGAAVDGFNLNSAYFERAQVPVLGAIFNKLEPTGFYSLEACREQVSLYFNQLQPLSPSPPPAITSRGEEGEEQTLKKPAPPPSPPCAFGFVPVFPQITGPKALQHVHEFIDTFARHVDVASIIQAASKCQGAPVVIASAISHSSKASSTSSSRTLRMLSLDAPVAFSSPSWPKKRMQVMDSTMTTTTTTILPTTKTTSLSTVSPPPPHNKKTRQEIERLAIHAGAAPSA